MTNDLDIKLAAIKTLLEAFKMERLLYVIISAVSVIVLLGTSLFLLFNQESLSEGNPAWFIGLFVPAGAITYSIGRILKMWNQAIAFIGGQIKND